MVFGLKKGGRCSVACAAIFLRDVSKGAHRSQPLIARWRGIPRWPRKRYPSGQRLQAATASPRMAVRSRHRSARCSRCLKEASSGSRASWTSGISRCLSPLPRRIMRKPRRAEICTSGIWSAAPSETRDSAYRYPLTQGLLESFCQLCYERYPWKCYDYMYKF